MDLNKLTMEHFDKMSNYVLLLMGAFILFGLLSFVFSSLASGEINSNTASEVKSFVTDCHDGIAYYDRTSFILYEQNTSEPVTCDVAGSLPN